MPIKSASHISPNVFLEKSKRIKVKESSCKSRFTWKTAAEACEYVCDGYYSIDNDLTITQNVINTETQYLGVTKLHFKQNAITRTADDILQRAIHNTIK